MKKDDKTLTYEQARELKFFCKNVVGVRQDMYEIVEKVDKFDARIRRLEKTCELIEKYFGEKIEAFKSPFINEENSKNGTSKK